MGKLIVIIKRAKIILKSLILDAIEKGRNLAAVT